MRYLPMDIQLGIWHELVQLHQEDHPERVHLRARDPPNRHAEGAAQEEFRRNPLIGLEAYPHYFDPEFVGKLFASQLSRTYHEEKTFIVDHPADLKRFLAKDRFGSECVPREHIRAIEVELSLQLFNVDDGRYKMWSNPKYLQPLRTHYVRAVKGLELLKSLEKRVRIAIVVNCHQTNGTSRFAEALVPLIYDLQNRDHTVAVDDQDMTDAQIARFYDYATDKRAQWDWRIQNRSVFVSLEMSYHASRRS
jgi:hypothetical protein